MAHLSWSYARRSIVEAVGIVWQSLNDSGAGEIQGQWAMAGVELHFLTSPVVDAGFYSAGGLGLWFVVPGAIDSQQETGCVQHCWTERSLMMPLAGPLKQCLELKVQQNLILRWERCSAM
mgnify:FL=1